MFESNLPEWEQLLSAAAHLQEVSTDYTVALCNLWMAFYANR